MMYGKETFNLFPDIGLIMWNFIFMCIHSCTSNIWREEIKKKWERNELGKVVE